ncbi:MAG TPA: class I SAM-dependent RNA methyltransferase [Bacteroidia bacterium]|nr:class I SAM-dependent RNA methyltransferase [Bacteroidia bacterium]
MRIEYLPLGKNILNQKEVFFVSCAPHVTPWLKQELTACNFPPFEENYTGLFIKATFQDVILLNYKLLSASRILWLIDKFKSSDQKQLYKKLNNIRWSDYFSEKKYITVTSQTNHPSINNSMFLNQLCKDAIVDYYQKNFNIRPDSGPLRSEVVIHIHWQHDQVWVYLDTSGEQLNKHGYRQNPFKAPVQENLAAAIIYATGWDRKSSFINPMCGSGTFAIEAALMAGNCSPLLDRVNFGYMHLFNYDKKIQRHIKSRLEDEKDFTSMPAIIATDNNGYAIKATRENSNRAGVEHYIEMEKCDFKETKIPGGPGVVLVNPPYGERLGEKEDLGALYTSIGDFFKQKCKRKTGFIFTGDLALAKKVGLRTAARIPFFNGTIECRLLKYDLY